MSNDKSETETPDARREIQAMAACWGVLEDLAPPQRARVLRWLEAHEDHRSTKAASS